jgi:hypothetical protein
VAATGGTPASVSVFAGDNQLAFAGTVLPIAPAVRVVDANDNPVPNVDVTFTIGTGGGTVAGGPVTFTVTAGSSTLVGASQVASINGTPTLAQWVIGTVGANQITITAGGASPIAITANGVP